MEDQERGLDISLKQVLLVLSLGFGATLAVIVGKQMSAEAMAVVIGIVCGVAASIPTSLLLVAATTRRDRQRREEDMENGRQGRFPPVVVIQGGAPQALTPGLQAGYWPAPPSSPMMNRQFHVVGDDDLILDG